MWKSPKITYVELGPNLYQYKNMNFLDHIADPKNPTDKPRPSSGLGVIMLLIVLLGVLGFMIATPNTSQKARDQKIIADEQLFKFDPQVASDKDNNSPNKQPKITEPNQSSSKPFPTTTPTQNNPKSPASVVPSATSDKSFTIRVANGSDTDGLASKYANSLKSKGFNVITINNALSKIDQTTIFYLKGKKSKADLISSELGNPQAKFEEFEEGDISDSADIIIVLGSDRDD